MDSRACRCPTARLSVEYHFIDPSQLFKESQMMETNLDKVLSLHIESLQCIAGNDLSVLLMLHAGSMLRCLCSVESWQPAGLQAVWQHVGEVMQHYGHTVPGQPQLCQQIFLEMFKIIWLHVRCKYFLCDNSCTLEPVLWQEPGVGGGRMSRKNI